MLSPLKTPLFPSLSCRPQLSSHFELLSRIYHVGFKAHGFWASVTDVKQLRGEVLQSHVFHRISNLHLQEARLEVYSPFNRKYSITGKLKDFLWNHTRMTSSSAFTWFVKATFTKSYYLTRDDLSCTCGRVNK